jgi:hypothetical protein
MTDDLDPQVHDAYLRLGTALAPPPDVATRVVRRVAARRRHRRVAAGGVGLVVAAGVVGGLVALGGGSSSDTVAVDQPATHGSFTITRADGSTWTTSELTLTCQPPPGEPFSPGGPQHIWLLSPRHVSADGKVLGDPFVSFSGIVDKIGGKTFQLPLDQASDTVPLVLFAADPDVPATAERANEVSSAEAQASGTVTVTEASCDPTPVLTISADTTLGSEVEQGTLKVSGSFSSR